jgi:drug/metabolite transporter (DMT)-like permease
VRGRGTSLGAEGPLVLAAILIGLNFIAIKVAVESIPPLLVGALRFAVGGLLLLAFVRLMRLRSRPTRRFLLTTLGIGLIGGTLYNVALTEGTSMTSASNASLIMATSTVWGMLLAAGLGVEPLRATNVIGAVVSLVGVVIILGRGLEGGGSSLVGDLVVFAASVSFAAYVVLSRAQHTHYPPVSIAAHTIFLGGLAVFPFTPLGLASWNWGSVSAAAWIAVAYMAIFSTALGYGIWQWGTDLAINCPAYTCRQLGRNVEAGKRQAASNATRRRSIEDPAWTPDGAESLVALVTQARFRILGRLFDHSPKFTGGRDSELQ